MHIIFLLFVALPLAVLLFQFFIGLPFTMAADGNPGAALLFIVVFWGVPFLLVAGMSHR